MQIAHRSRLPASVLSILLLSAGLACQSTGLQPDGGAKGDAAITGPGGTTNTGWAGQSGGAGTSAAGSSGGQGGSGGVSTSTPRGSSTGGKGGSTGSLSNGSSSLPLCAVDCFVRSSYRCTSESTYRGYGPVGVPAICSICGGQTSRCTGTICGYTTDEVLCPTGTRCVQPQGPDAGIQGACRPITDAGMDGQDAASADTGHPDVGTP